MYGISHVVSAVLALGSFQDAPADSPERAHPAYEKLTHCGVPGDRARELVEKALERGFSAEGVVQIAASVEATAQAGGIQAGAAAEVAIHALARAEASGAEVLGALRRLEECLRQVAGRVREFSDEQRRRLAEALARAAACGREAIEYVADKIQEGVCKHVDPERIVRTIQGKAQDLRRIELALEAHVRTALSAEARGHLLVEIQQAVDMGVSVDLAGRIVRAAVGARGDARLAIAAVRLAGVASSSGMPPERALGIVEAGLRKGYGAVEMGKQAAFLVRCHQQSIPMAQVGRTMEQAIARTRGADSMFVAVQAQLSAHGTLSAPPATAAVSGGASAASTTSSGAGTLSTSLSGSATLTSTLRQ